MYKRETQMPAQNIKSKSNQHKKNTGKIMTAFKIGTNSDTTYVQLD